MYLWKCWRETRFFTIVFLIIAAAVMPVTAALSSGTHFMEEFGRPVFTSALTFILTGMALWLGVIGALHGFDDKTVQFLFTKPRSRTSFAWIGWAVGCAELLVVGLLNVFAGWLTLSMYNSHVLISEVFGASATQDYTFAFVLSLLCYCSTYAFTAVLRNGVNGLGAGMGSWIVYDLVALTARWRWNIQVPFPCERIGSLSPGISNFLWIIVALCYLLVAQIVVERAEV